MTSRRRWSVRRWLPAVVFSATALAATGLAFTPSVRAPGNPPSSPPVVPAAAVASTAARWNQLAPGARRLDLDADGVAILLLQFDLDRFRADVVVGAGTPPAATTAAALRASPAAPAVAVVNGGFFDEHRAPLGLRIAGGDTRVKLRPRVDWGVLVVSDRDARIIHSRDFHPSQGIRAAIQVGPRLIVDGVPLKLRPQVARRTAVALDREGGTMTLVIADAPIEAGVLATHLASLGFDSALLLDGGPSTQLSFRLAGVDVDIVGGYPVPDLLAIYAR